VSRAPGLRRYLQPPPGGAPAPATETGPAGAVPGAEATDTATGQAAATSPGAGPGLAGVPIPGLAAARPGGATSPESARQAGERCEMCATPIGPSHGHVADLEKSSLVCACRACYLLFTDSGAGRGRYRAVPERYLRDPARPLTPADWADLEVPVGLAFFLYSSDRGEVCGFYPSPAGATECTLDLAAWARLSHGHPLLSSAEPDVEAVLVTRTDSSVEYFLVPIDACYELTGRMRMLWRGFDGGAEARASIAEFLATVRDRARDLVPES
jgi:Family of unknown function (DUF5947)